MEVWGDKPKSQTDPTTVDQEIDGKIQDHLDDPDAHIETGQSLQSHKASEIIDHLAKSIIEDKIGDGEISSRCITTDQIVGKDIRTSADVGADVDGVSILPTGIEMWQGGDKKVDIPVSGDPTFKGNTRVNMLTYLRLTFRTMFESITGWAKTTHVYNYFGNLVMTTSGVLNAYEYCHLPTDDLFALCPNFEKAGSFSTTLALDQKTNLLCYFGIGPLDSSEGIGFKIVNSNVYAIWYETDWTEHAYLLSGIDPTVLHVYAFEKLANKTINFYVDNVLKQFVDASAYDFNSSANTIFYYYIKTTNDGSKSLYCWDCLYQQDY